MTSLRITKDRRIFLNEQEIKKCSKLSVIMEGGCDPEIELKITVDKVDIDGYEPEISDRRKWRSATKNA